MGDEDILKIQRSDAMKAVPRQKIEKAHTLARLERAHAEALATVKEDDELQTAAQVIEAFRKAFLEACKEGLDAILPPDVIDEFALVGLGALMKTIYKRMT